MIIVYTEKGNIMNIVYTEKGTIVNVVYTEKGTCNGIQHGTPPLSWSRTVCGAMGAKSTNKATHLRLRRQKEKRCPDPRRTY